jgi:hypothetical protein
MSDTTAATPAAVIDVLNQFRMCPFSCEKRAALKAAAILTDVLTNIKDQVFTGKVVRIST